MKIILVACVAMLALTGCGGCSKEPVCNVAKTGAAALATQIAVQLDCKDVGAITADIEGKLVDLKVCEAKPQGTIGDVLCGPVVEGLSQLWLNQIPSTWQCSGGKITEEGKAKLLEVCKNAI